MKLQQLQWDESETWKKIGDFKKHINAQLVLAFGSRAQLMKDEACHALKDIFPGAHMMACSTSGEILDTKVMDDTITATAIEFEKTKTNLWQVNISDCVDSRDAGRKLGSQLPHEGLVHVMIFSDGSHVNGTELVDGLSSVLPTAVAVTGGLAGNAALFEKTVVGLDCKPAEGNIAAIGFYGADLKIGYGSMGGWDPFGPVRIVTKSVGNILYELDGKNALELYKTYLGDKAAELPGSALLFPLSIKVKEQEHPVVRTILSIDHNAGTMTFAGDMPEGAEARLMKANFDRLVDGASDAAKNSTSALGKHEPELAILISCVGRKLVLGPHVEDEVESVRQILGPKAVLAGFYSYGELAPFTQWSKTCELHNQTMTITTFSEE